MARFFNPAWAEQHLSFALVDDLTDLAFVRHHALIDELREEAKAYLSACVSAISLIDDSDMHIFSKGVLASGSVETTGAVESEGGPTMRSRGKTNEQSVTNTQKQTTTDNGYSISCCHT